MHLQFGEECLELLSDCAAANRDMSYLRDLIEDCLEQYGSCGLEITETEQAGEGALYKSSVHNKRFKAKARKNKGITRRSKLRSIYE